MVPITVAVSATDNYGVVSTRIEGVTSKEPADANNDRNSPTDCEITGDLSVHLRAERSGSGLIARL
jgi:hypothetical protein